MKESTAIKLVVGFVLEQAEHLPIKRRIHLYRAAAEIAGDESESKALKEMARTLELADAQCAEFQFTVTLKNKNHFAA